MAPSVMQPIFLEIFDDAGKPAKARFAATISGVMLEITVDSRGGAIGSSNERNSGYSAGLKLLLERLASKSVVLEDSLLVSGPALATDATVSERRLHPQGFDLPLEMSPKTNTSQLARSLQRAQGALLSKSKSGAGNTTRRIAILVTPTSNEPDMGWAGWLAGSGGLGKIPSQDLEEAAKANDFDPAGLTDAKKRIITSIALRQGQPKFRRGLLKAYSSRCAITGCAVLKVLEAAHIVPYKGEQTNHVQNGLLLRADLHTLFDVGLLGVAVSDGHWTVVLHEDMRDEPTYSGLHGSPLSLPTKIADQPNMQALREHLVAAGLEN